MALCRLPCWDFLKDLGQFQIGLSTFNIHNLGFENFIQLIRMFIVCSGKIVEH